MTSTTLWVLIFIAAHGYSTVPGIVSEQECERLHKEIRASNLSYSIRGTNYRCLSYQAGR